MDEFELIRRYFTRSGPQAATIVTGIGDDGAVTRPPPGEELVTVTDTLVAGTHFPADQPPRAIGHRALAVNLSDLAAMGARPLWFTLNLATPAPEPDWLEAFAAGLFALADAHAIVLIGGDTVRGPLSVTVTAIGAVPPGAALLRSGAGPEEGIYVTGTLGDAGYAWRALALEERLAADDPLRHRLEFPEPRIDAGCALRGIATAVIDISDGLQPDLGHLLSASGVGADCDADAVPVSAALRERVAGERAIELAVCGGDDYELCFTVPPAREAALAVVSAGWCCGVTRIGTTTRQAGLRWQRAGASWTPPAGYLHFAGDGA